MKHLTRQLISFLIAVVLSLTVFTAIAESGFQGLFPQFDEIFKELPSLTAVVNRPADREETLWDGRTRLTWEHITAEDFDAFSIYLVEQGCTLNSYEVQNNVFTAAIRIEELVFFFRYELSTGTATLTYGSEVVEGPNEVGE